MTRPAANDQNGMISTPDGKTWMGLVPGPQENGAWTLRIAVRDEAAGTTREYAYENRLGNSDPARDAILALNDHQLLVLENRGAEGKDAGLPDRVWAVDLTGAKDITGLSNAEAGLAAAPAKIPFGDATAALRSFGLLEAETAVGKEAAASASGGASEGIAYDPAYLAGGETFLRQEEAAGGSLSEFFAGMDLGIPGLGRLARDPAAMPGMGGLVVVVLGVLVLSRLARRRPLPFRR